MRGETDIDMKSGEGEIFGAMRVDGSEERLVKLELSRKSPPSVIYVNYRSIYEDNYPAKFDDEVARLLLQLYTQEGDTVLDPMAGSGVIPIEAVKLNRNAVAFDINPVAVNLITEKWKDVQERYKVHGQLDVHLNDSRKIPLAANSIEFILTSPPFGLTISDAYDKYSNHPDDLANSKNYDGWRVGLKLILAECLRVLKPDKLLAIEIRPRAKEGHNFPLFAWIENDAEELGFEYFAEYIEIVMPWRMWTMGQELQRKPFPAHSHILMFTKPENSKLEQFVLPETEI